MKLNKKPLEDCVIGIIGCGKIGKNIVEDLIKQGYKHLILMDYAKDENDEYIVETLADELTKDNKELDIMSCIGAVSIHNVSEIFESDVDLVYWNIDRDIDMYKKIMILSNSYKIPVIFWQDYNNRILQ